MKTCLLMVCYYWATRLFAGRVFYRRSGQKNDYFLQSGYTWCKLFGKIICFATNLDKLRRTAHSERYRTSNLYDLQNQNAFS